MLQAQSEITRRAATFPHYQRRNSRILRRRASGVFVQFVYCSRSISCIVFVLCERDK
jgi:hypothetical protein